MTVGPEVIGVIYLESIEISFGLSLRMINTMTDMTDNLTHTHPTWECLGKTHRASWPVASWDGRWQ